MGQRARPPLLSTWTLLGCAAALALAVLFWHSLGTVIAGWIAAVENELQKAADRLRAGS